MIYQHDKDLKIEIQKAGCYLLSLLAIIEIENRTAFTANQINDLYNKFVRKGWILNNCSIEKPDELLNYLLDDKKIYQIGVCEKGKTSFWGWVEDKSFDWIIANHTTTGLEGNHFTLMDNGYRSFYDSLREGDYNSIGIDRYIFYKIYKRAA